MKKEGQNQHERNRQKIYKEYHDLLTEGQEFSNFRELVELFNIPYEKSDGAWTRRTKELFETVCTMEKTKGHKFKITNILTTPITIKRGKAFTPFRLCYTDYVVKNLTKEERKYHVTSITQILRDLEIITPSIEKALKKRFSPNEDQYLEELAVEFNTDKEAFMTAAKDITYIMYFQMVTKEMLVTLHKIKIISELSKIPFTIIKTKDGRTREICLYEKETNSHTRVYEDLAAEWDNLITTASDYYKNEHNIPIEEQKEYYLNKYANRLWAEKHEFPVYEKYVISWNSDLEQWVSKWKDDIAAEKTIIERFKELCQKRVNSYYEVDGDLKASQGFGKIPFTKSELVEAFNLLLENNTISV